MNPLLMTDGYKTSHHLMYPKGTTMVYSNYTCRSTKRMNDGAKDVVVFGIQYMIRYLEELWVNKFFGREKSTVCNEAKKYLSSYLGTDYDVSHFERLHDLGYLPIEIKALEEGTVTTEGIPLFTIKNTHPDFYWITNFLETMLSTLIWKPVHSASLAYAYKKLLVKYAIETDKNNVAFVDFQGHDFSFRGMQSPEAAIASAMGFLTSFKGTDTIPALQAIRKYYRDTDVGFSVPASEHSVMCSHGKEGEIDTLKYLMSQYPKGILSVVSDTWDLWKLITEYLSKLKEEILARDGKLVIRPDSGNPVDIICGERIYKMDVDSIEEVKTEMLLNKGYSLVNINSGIYELTTKKHLGYEDSEYTRRKKLPLFNKSRTKGVIELLWDIFGGTVNEQGYKVLDPHIGAIYGDSITLERAEQICERLKAKGFASTNVVLGIGSYSMGYATRDNQGGAVKSTYVEVDGKPREIFKDPVTDNGEKKSAKGLLMVFKNDLGELDLLQQRTWTEEEQGELKTIFKNGSIIKETNFEEIRKRINSY